MTSYILWIWFSALIKSSYAIFRSFSSWAMVWHTFSYYLFIFSLSSFNLFLSLIVFSNWSFILSTSAYNFFISCYCFILVLNIFLPYSNCLLVFSIIPLLYAKFFFKAAFSLSIDANLLKVSYLFFYYPLFLFSFSFKLYTSTSRFLTFCS